MNKAHIQNIRDRYEIVQNRIQKAAEITDQNPHEVKLVVVTKSRSLETVKAVIAAEIHDLGENYADEAQPKIQAIADPDVCWHMIGHVQSRKANLVVQYFNLLHSLDSHRLAARLNRIAEGHNRILPVLLQMNVSGEETKFGWDAWDKSSWENLLPDIEKISRLSKIEIKGLMTIAPIGTDHETARPYFAKLRELRNFINNQVDDLNMVDLSMGMSSDYVAAVKEGATYVRVGTAILGDRKR